MKRRHALPHVGLLVVVSALLATGGPARAQPSATNLPAKDFPWACEMRVGDPDGHVLRFGSDPKKGP